MKEQYRWNYNIKIKTKDGEYEYEQETLENLKEILEKHKDYEEVSATQCKHKENTENTKRVDKCKKKVLRRTNNG